MGDTPASAEIGPGSYGLGWMIDSYRGHRRVHHGGNIDGFSALVTLFPQDGFGFVMLTNKNGSALPELLTRHAVDLILGIEGKDWIGEVVKRREAGEELEQEAEEKKAARRIKGTKPSHPPADYAGTYFHPGYGRLLVELESGKLAFTYNGMRSPLDHWHYDTYNGGKAEDPTFEDMKLNFRTDAAGRITALEAPFEASLDPIVFDKQPDPKYSDPGYLKRFVGRYRMLEQTITISLKGSVMTATVPGQPAYELVPELGDEFSFKQVKIITVSFKLDEQGGVTAMEVVQPGGVFEFKRIK